MKTVCASTPAFEFLRFPARLAWEVNMMGWAMKRSWFETNKPTGRKSMLW
jgi:hypothetical protein